VLYIAEMRYTGKIAIGLYLALIVVWIYWVLDRQLFFGNEIAGWLGIIGVGLAHVALGVFVNRGWALFLALLPVAIALPAGYPSANQGEPLPLWLGALIWSPLNMSLVAIGVGARRRYEGRRIS
jgi:hypothetical protein